MEVIKDILDKVGFVNLYGSGSLFVIKEIDSSLQISTFINSMSRQNILENALFISAVTGAIYGVYRIVDLILKGINKIYKNKIKNSEN